MLQTSILPMKSLNKTETPIFYLLCVLCVPTSTFYIFILVLSAVNYSAYNKYCCHLLVILKVIFENSVDPNQTAPVGAV